MKKPKLIIGVLAIVGFTTLLMVNFGNSISTYTNFTDAAKQQSAHVVGKWEDSKAYGFSIESKQFTFYMEDQDGNVRKVIYPKPKPNNFEEAEKLVVIGSMQNGVFYANDMLMKCPSKYNATGEEAQFKPAEAAKS